MTSLLSVDTERVPRNFSPPQSSPRCHGMWAKEYLHVASIQNDRECSPPWVWYSSWEIPQACEGEMSPKWARESHEKERNGAKQWLKTCPDLAYFFHQHVLFSSMGVSHTLSKRTGKSGFCYCLKAHPNMSGMWWAINFLQIIIIFVGSSAHNRKHLWPVKYHQGSFKIFFPIMRQVYDMHLVVQHLKTSFQLFARTTSIFLLVKSLA